MYIDRIDLTLPEADLQSILAYFLSAEELLEPLPSVSKSDRKRYAKLGLKNEALALQILEIGRHNPDLIPRGINFERIDRDLTARNQLRSLKLLLERLLGRVDDSMLLTGVDLYAAALSIYHCLRRNADTTSLRETVDELKRGFARPGRKKKAEVEIVVAPVTEATVAVTEPERPPSPVREPVSVALSVPAQPRPAQTTAQVSSVHPTLPAASVGAQSAGLPQPRQSWSTVPNFIAPYSVSLSFMAEYDGEPTSDPAA